MHQITGMPWGQWLPRLLPWLNTLIVILLAWSAAGVSWRIWLYSYDDAALLPVAISDTTSVNADSPPASLDKVAALHLFGEVAAVRAAPVKSNIDAPETRLRLTLKGIIAVSDAGQGRALIAVKGDVEKVYKSGDVISAGAVLHEVQPDKVILKRAGRFETLTLPRESTAGAKVAGKRSRDSNKATQRPPRTSRRGAVTQQLRSLRDSVVEEPSKAFDLVKAQPVMDGGMLKGYRVNPGKERRLFQRAGLRAGDVVTSVNGISLNDPAQMMTLFEQFKSSDRFDLMVERGGRQTSLTIDLGK